MNLSKGLGAIAYAIASRLKECGHIAYLAGGCVRDSLMNVEAKDFDIATTATPDIVGSIFQKTVPVGKQYGVVLVIEDKHQFEVATFRSEEKYLDGRHPTAVHFCSPEEDAKRRDFTINGLFYDPFTKRVLDFVNGRNDIERRIIRAIGDPRQRFEEDKLRLLRAVRFAANLGFEIEDETWRAIYEKGQTITQTSPERIRDELKKMFTRSRAGRGLELLSDSGLLKIILPEIEAMKGVEQPEQFHPEGDAFKHTQLLLDQLINPSEILAFAALFHDVGKPSTFVVRKGRKTFYEHAPIGARMTEEIMRRLRFSNDEIEAVTSCVENHMKFADVQRMRVGKLKKLISRQTFKDELELHRIDCQASHGILDNYYYLQDKMKEFAAENLKPQPFVTGHDLIALGMKPGPRMKPILEEAYELQLEGQFKDSEQALDWLKKKLSSLSK